MYRRMKDSVKCRFIADAKVSNNHCKVLYLFENIFAFRKTYWIVRMYSAGNPNRSASARSFAA